MLTLDDCNTIYKKYEYNNFFYKFSQVPSKKPIDFLDTKLMIDTTDCSLFYGLVVRNSFWTGGYFLKSKTADEYSEMDFSDPSDEFALNVPLGVWEDYDLYLHMAVDKDIQFSVMNLEWHPVSSLTMSVYDNGEFIPKKIYLDFHGHTVPETVFAGSYDNDISSLTATFVNHDNDGYYIDAVVDDFTKSLFAIVYDGAVFYGKINHLKMLPFLGADKLYKGTPQKIKIKTNDGVYIDKFQAYYNGKKLEDNIINLPHDVSDVIEITVDLLDPNYPNSTLKLKVGTELYNVEVMSDLVYAINNGIRTIKIVGTVLPYYVIPTQLYDVNLKDIVIVDSNFTLLKNITLENVKILNSNITMGNEIIFNNCEIQETTLTNGLPLLVPTMYNECTIKESIIDNMELHFTGVITDSTLRNSLIISDGVTELINNIFTGIFPGLYSKKYFPSFLYLTGDYLIKSNTFNLTGEWDELNYNMCIIKTLQGFNPNEFLDMNNLNINITFETEDPNTFYYNLVDDDKIRAVRLD